MTGDRAETTGVGRIDWPALAIVGIGGVLLRLLYLDQPMRYDEAYSFLYFALPSLRTAVSDYTVPNNHIFHTVLVWISTHLFGSSPQAIRLPVFFAGLLSVPAAWFAARSLAGRGAGLFAAALTAVLPSLLLYSTNARAYMLVGLGTLLLVWVGSRLLDEESLSHWMVIVVIGALGLWAAPVMLYPLGVVMWWLLAERVRTDGARGALRFVPRLGAAAALIGVLTIILYLPVLLRGGAGQLTNNRFVKPGTWAEVATQLVILARDLRALLGLGLSRVEVVLALLIALVGVGAPGEHRQRRMTLASARTRRERTRDSALPRAGRAATLPSRCARCRRLPRPSRDCSRARTRSAVRAWRRSSSSPSGERGSPIRPWGSRAPETGGASPARAALAPTQQ